MQLRLSFLFRPTTAGKPRHYSYSLTSFTPKNSTNSTLRSSVVALLKYTMVFSLFIFCPEASSYRCNKWRINSKSPLMHGKKARYHRQRINEWFLGHFDTKRSLQLPQIWLHVVIASLEPPNKSKIDIVKVGHPAKSPLLAEYPLLDHHSPKLDRKLTLRKPWSNPPTGYKIPFSHG